MWMFDLQICDELNFPTLRRVIDWKENEREWKYVLPQVSSADYKVSCYYQHAGYIKVSGHLHSSAALRMGKEPLVPIGCKTGWSPELVWTIWKVKILHCTET
jgi:hypothetical protein